MHEMVIGWDDGVPVDGDHVMFEEGAGSPRNGDSVAFTAAGVAAGSAGVGDDSAVPLSGASVLSSHGDVSRKRKLVSPFGRLGSAVLPRLSQWR